MDGNKIRQSDIAERLHISRTTVARAFNGRHVSEKTREQVLATAKEMGYIPNVVAGALAQKKSKTVYCFIVGTIDEGYVSHMIRGMKDAEKIWNGYNFGIKIFITDINQRGNKCCEQMDQFYETMEERHPDGVIFSALSQENMDEVSDYCKKYDIPVMSLDVIYKDTGLCHIGSDYFHFGEVSAAYLASVMKYSGRILCIFYDDGYELSKIRMQGFFSRLSQCPQIEYLNIDVDNISYGTYKRVLKHHLYQYSPDAIYAPYKMDYVIQALQGMDSDKGYIMVSNGINQKIEKYLFSGELRGIISYRPYQLGSVAVNNFFNYFYRPTEVIKNTIDVGCDIFIKENYVRYKSVF